MRPASSAARRERLQVTAEFLRRNEAHQAVRAALVAGRREEGRGRRSERVEALHQRLVLVVVRGDVVMTNYWNQPEASAETLRGGWLHTGDMGSFDEDGFLTLRDRSKDLIISGGMNIYPREVEEVLLQHSAVTAVAVVGKPDAEWGEAVIAFVVANPDASPTTAELDQMCLDRIARFKRPKEYRFVDSLPTNNYGKVVKRELREMLAAEQK